MKRVKSMSKIKSICKLVCYIINMLRGKLKLPVVFAGGNAIGIA